MTWRDFSIYKIAKERNDLLQIALTRKIVHTVFASVATKNNWKSETDFWPLPMDEPKAPVKILSPEEIKIISERYTRPQRAKA